MQLVSAWNDDSHVYLVERVGDAVRGRRVPAPWAAFAEGLSESDRRNLAKLRDVTGVRQDGAYTRVDFRDRWGRTRVCRDVLEKAVERSGCGAVLEADVSPLRRLLSDSPALEVASEFRLGYFDLEADPRGGFEALVEGKRRLLVWHLRDASGTQRDTGILQADSDEAEADFLASFLVAAEKYDVLLAWNGEAFDFQAFANRCKRLRVRVRGREPELRRWCWLDQMLVYKKYNQAHDSGEERASLALDAVSKLHLGVGKADYDAKQCWADWEAGGERLATLVKYCEVDVERMPGIEEKTGFVALHLAVCKATRCVPDTASLGAAQQGDGYLLRLGAEFGYHFPTKRYGEDEEERFAGAFVMEPRRLGVLEHVRVCDFAGLYPSIIRTWNMSLDTLADGCGAEVPTCKLPARATRFRTDRRGMFPRALDTLVEQRGAYTERADAAEPGSPEANYYKRLSSAFKIINNSMYGIIGSTFTRFYNRDVAEGVTSTGVWLLKEHVVPAMRRAGAEVEYGDTDSAMVSGLSHDSFSDVVGGLNEGWPSVVRQYGCGANYVKLEYEKAFERMVLVGKKRYAARYSLWKGKPVGADKKPEVKGLEYKRGDTLRLTRAMQSELIGLLLRVGEVPGEEEVVALVEEWRRRVLVGEVQLDDVVVSQSVKDLDEYKVRYTTATCRAGSKGRECGYGFGDVAAGPGRATKCPRCKTERKLVKQPAHVRLARVLESRGEGVTPGTRVRYLMVRPAPGEGAEEDGVVPVLADEPGAFERIDRDYYWDKKVYPASQRILEACYPSKDWRDSATKRRRVAQREGLLPPSAKTVDDLPLFAVQPPAEAAPQSKPGRRGPRPRQQPREVPAEVELRAPLALAEAGEAENERVFGRLAEVARAYPGKSRVVVVLDFGDRLVRVPTETRVAATSEVVGKLTAVLAEVTN